MEDRGKNHVKEERLSSTEEKVREKLQALEDLAVSYDQKCGEVRGLEDELNEQVDQLEMMKEQLLQLAEWISGPDPGPETQYATEGGAPGGRPSEELMDWMLSVKDDEIEKQRRLIEELRRQVTESRDAELRLRTQTYWKLKEKDDEIHKQSRMIGELRGQVREKEELISAAKVQLIAITEDSQPRGSPSQRQQLPALAARPLTQPVPTYLDPQDSREQPTALLHLIAITKDSQTQGPPALIRYLPSLLIQFLCTICTASCRM